MKNSRKYDRYLSGSVPKACTGLAIAIVAGTIAVCSIRAQDAVENASTSESWPMFGQNIANTASVNETNISTSNVSKLKPKWTFTTEGDVSARAAVVNGVVYFPDWGGNLWAVNASTGKKLWSHNLTHYGLSSGTYSRTSPAVADGKVYIGTNQDGWLLAINAETGNLVWKSQPVPSTNDPQITGSPTVTGNVVYLGLTTTEEGLAENIHYACCTTKGAVVAVNANNGTLLWRTYTVPSGYSGAGVWSSGPVVDESRHTVFVTTGNNYSTPTAPAYLACIAAGQSTQNCQSPEDYADSIIALNSETGAVRWGKRLMQWAGTIDSDDFNLSCRTAPYTNCPQPTGPDLDFASGPNEISYKTSKGTATLIGAGQKSGIYYALNPDTGAELWHTQVGPAGIQWGSASDGQRIYVAISNSAGVSYAAGTAGSWAALNPATGAILWQTPDPSGSIDLGALAVVNGIVYAPSMAPSATAKNMIALNAEKGDILWSYPAGSSVNAGAAIVNGIVYWGSGYEEKSGFTGGKNKFYAFSENGK
jgi:polyvinyl alcohol dehydrogenase (cytochrome)